jgi:hypothetical protein
MTARSGGRRRRRLLLGVALGLAALPALAAGSRAPADDTRYVIHVSVDGLRGDAVRRLGPAAAPRFHRLMIEGAFTENARTDYDFTITLPDHACEFTSRPVLGSDGHGLTYNSDDGRTLAEVHGSYVAGVFDVAHDNGLSTGLYASKSKFALFERTWDAVHGALDTTGIDDGRNKIDTYVYDEDTDALVTTFLTGLLSSPRRYGFIHLVDLDAVGHAYGWESEEYFQALRKIDGLIGRILDAVDGDARLAGRTYLVVTADHAGAGTDHSDAANPACYTIPFFVWGPAVPAGADLYRLNEGRRADPAGGRPPYTGPQPIRNGEAANLSLWLLGLPRVPGSSIDAAQDLEPFLPAGSGALPAVSFTTPSPGATLAYPSDVVIAVEAEPGGPGGIARVEFYENSIPLAADSTFPFSYTWTGAPFGSYRITARAVRDDGAASTASVSVEIASMAGVPVGRSMLPAPPRIYPNPSDRLSTIEFSLADRGGVELGLYDVGGRRLGTLFNGSLDGGVHAMPFDTAAYAPGVYFLALRSGAGVRTLKLMVVR